MVFFDEIKKGIFYKDARPHFWLILSPLLFFSFFYGIILKIRPLIYSTGIIKKRRLSANVISIGNLTVGGTGKTPMVIAIAELLIKHGKKPAILSRGYKSKEEGNLKIVSDGKDIKLDPASAGDEPYLMAERLKNVPVLICSDRYESGSYAVESFGADTIILDDGFQNLALKKDTDILLIDAMNPFGNGYLLPRGILREPLSAIKRADIIVITRSDNSVDINNLIDTIRLYNSLAPLFKAIYELSMLINIKSGRTVDLRTLKNKPVAIFSGIANPASFSNLIKSLGANIVNEAIFTDHQIYTLKDIERIINNKKEAEMIITTEKDAVKIRGMTDNDIGLWALRADVKILDKIDEWESVFLKK